MRSLLPALLAATVLLSGCYHAQMTTTKDPADTIVQERWAPSYLYGLVPAELDVSDECSNGIAEAERQLRFPNMLVSVLTLNIYTPQTITVTCAEGGMMSTRSTTEGVTGSPVRDRAPDEPDSEGDAATDDTPGRQAPIAYRSFSTRSSR